MPPREALVEGRGTRLRERTRKRLMCGTFHRAWITALLAGIALPEFAFLTATPALADGGNGGAPGFGGLGGTGGTPTFPTGGTGSSEGGGSFGGGGGGGGGVS